MVNILYIVITLLLSLVLLVLLHLVGDIYNYALSRMVTNYDKDIEITFEDIELIMSSCQVSENNSELVLWKDNTRLFIHNYNVTLVDNGVSRRCYFKNFYEFLKFVVFIDRIER